MKGNIKCIKGYLLCYITVFLLGYMFNQERAKWFVISYVIITIIDLINYVAIKKLNYNSKFIYTIQRMLLFIPLCIPTLVYKDNYFIFNLEIFYYCILGIIFALFIQLIEIKRWRFIFSKYSIAAVPKESIFHYFINCFCIFASSICEELYFRQYALSIKSNFNLILIVGSSLLFVFSHYLVPWDKFEWRDSFRFIILGISSCILFYVSRSIIPSICLHIFFDSLNILTLVNSFIRHYIRSDYYDKILSEEDDFDIFL